MRLFKIARVHSLRSSRSSLKRNFVWMFIGNAIYSACQWLLISVLAKMTTPESVGKYALAIAITAPLMYLANFSVGVMLVTDTLRQNRFEDYRNTRVVLIALSFLATAAICAASGFSQELFALTLIVGVSQFSDCMSELYRSAMFRSEMMSQVAISLIFRGLLSVSITTLILYQTRNLLWALAGMALSRIAVLVAFDIPMSRSVTAPDDRSSVFASATGRLKRFSLSRTLEAINFRRMLEITRTAFPLTIVTVLTSLVINLPRYFIEHYVGHRELGIFAAMWSLLTAGNMVAIAMGQAIFPKLSVLYSNNDLLGFKRLIVSAVQSGLVLGVLGILGAILLGKQILTLAYRAEYAEHQWIFVAVMATGMLVYIITLLGNAATSARAFKHQAFLMAAVATTTLIGSWLAVPRYGVLGAVVAITLGCFTHIAGLGLIVRSLWKSPAPVNPIASLSAKGA